MERALLLHALAVDCWMWMCNLEVVIVNDDAMACAAGNARGRGRRDEMCGALAAALGNCC